MNTTQAKERLIVPLDVDTKEEVRELVFNLRSWVGLFKIGMRLFFRYGPEIVRLVQESGGNIFLDAKLHDIPSVVEAASRSIGKMGARMFTVHTFGGMEMMRRCAEVIKGEHPQTRILGVTLLTSLDGQALKEELGIEGTPGEKVLFLATRAKEAKLDGVICSGEEIEVLRKSLGKDFLLVVPGIRMGKVNGDDQKRVLTPEEAIRRGADYLVVGRPIIQAPDAVKAARNIVEKMGSGLDI